MFYVYIIQSKTTGRYYVGFTENIENRVDGHNSGKTPSTRNKGPWELVYHEKYDSKTEALKREREIKAKKSSTSIRQIIAHDLQ